MRIGDEQGGLPGGGDLPRGAAGPRDHEISCRECGAEVVREGQEHVAGPPRMPCELRVVTLSREVENGRTVGREGLQRRFVQPARALASAENEDDLSLRGKAEALARLGRIDGLGAARNRAPDHAVLLAPHPVDRKGEEDAPGEGHGEAVGEAEVRVGLGEGSRDPQDSSGQDHRPGHVATGAEDDVGAAATEDPDALRGRRGRPSERPQEAGARLARETLHSERVEVEARVRGEALLDGVRTPGERDGRAAGAQSLRDGERGQDVPGGPACGYQASLLASRRHG
jgi:hypothetical protein